MAYKMWSKTGEIINLQQSLHFLYFVNIIKSVIFISKNVKNGDRRALRSTIPIRMLFNKVFYVLLFVI